MRALATLGLVLFLTGCATERDDQAFFNRGWVKPQEGADRRLYGPTKAPAPEPEDEIVARPPTRD